MLSKLTNLLTHCWRSAHSKGMGFFIYKIMATKTVFTDENYQMEVFINQYNKITFTTEYKLDENDYSVLSLENNDIEKLLIILKQLLKDNQNG